MSYTNTYSEIYHHGIKGQKWGVRNYQNPDGSLTPLGRQHYGYSTSAEAKDEISTREKKKTLKKLNKYNKRLESIEYEQQLYESNDYYKKTLQEYSINREDLKKRLAEKEKEYHKIVDDILKEHGDRIETKKVLRTYETKVSRDTGNATYTTSYTAKERLGKRYVDKTLTAIQSAKTDMGSSKINTATNIGLGAGFIGFVASMPFAIPGINLGCMGLILASTIANSINAKGEATGVFLPGGTVTTSARTEEYYDKQ